MIWWAIGSLLSSQHTSALDSAAADTTNLARAFEENTQRIVAGADQVILSLRAAYLREGQKLDLRDWVARESAPDWLTAQIAIIGPDGMSIASTASNRRVSVADREHFTVQRDAIGDELFISRPVIGRSSGRWTIQLTRRIMRDDGQFLGVVVLSIDCYQLSGFYQSMNLQQGFIELVGLDGIVRARGPVEGAVIGSSLPYLDVVLANQGGLFRASDGRDMITIAYRRLVNYPLVVLVGFSDKAILANFQHTKMVTIWSGVVATVLLGLIGVIWIRQRKRSIQSKDSLQLTLASMSQGLVMVDASGGVRVVNRRVLELLGLPLDMMTILNDSRSDDRPQAERVLIAALKKVHECRTRDMDQTMQQVLEATISVTPSGGKVHTVTDMTARHIADQRIRHMALHDHLTGLGNRILFYDEADHLLARPIGQRTCLAILCMDLNGFKKVNDTLGHEVGDHLLIEVARRLTGAVRANDLVVRIGGDEFSILSPLDDEKESEVIARRVLDALEPPFDIDGHQVTIGTCVGIAHYPAHGLTRPELLRRADLALYAAKADRQRPIRIFEPSMADHVRDKQILEQELREAIGTDQLFLEFQPQFRTSSLAVVGFEALVRWNHPTRGRLGPDSFVPIAEESGLIVPLGRQVLEQACQAALSWPDTINVAVNLSPVQFRDAQIVQTIQSVLERTGLHASGLELEVTEGVLIHDEHQAFKTLSELRDLGVRLTLDDFGTGYASLSYLRKFPFEKIKLDRSFVQAQVLEQRSRHILQAVLGLSRNLHLSVVAEGVETKTQLHLLREQGCHAVQGFLVGRPMSQHDVGIMLLADAPRTAYRPSEHNQVESLAPH